MASIDIEVKQLFDKAKGKLLFSLKEYGLVGRPEFNEPLELLDQLDDILTSVVKGPVELAQSSTIDKLGLGNQVLSLHNGGCTPAQIKNLLRPQIHKEIDTQEIKDWLDTYSNLSILNNPSVIKNSVFDTKVVMQTIFEDLQEHLKAVKKMEQKTFAQGRTTKEQVQLEIYKEIRQLTKDAAGILEAISQMEKYKEFQRVIIESISDVAPDVKHKIIKRLQEQKKLFSAIVPD